MFERIENLKLLDIVEGLSVVRGSFTCRPSHALIFKLTGSSVYTFAQRAYTLGAGQMFYLPKGASYRVDRISRGDSRYVLMNFDGTVDGAVPRVYDMDGFAHMATVRTELGRMWRMGGAAEQYQCLAVFYEALAHAAHREQLDYAHGRHLARIGPGLDYLKEHIFDFGLRAGQLHELCGVSDTYFRKVFKANYAVSVSRYITRTRLSQAAAILRGGDYESIAGVARAVGYADPLYFSRAFARHYGVSPSEYGK